MTTPSDPIDAALDRLLAVARQIEAAADRAAGATVAADADPFGLDWAWEWPDGEPAAATRADRFRAVAALPRADLFAAAADTLRTAAPSELLAGGTAEEFVHQWADGRFVALCLESDPALFQDLAGDADPTALAQRVADLLNGRAGFAAVPDGELAVLAVAVVDAIRSPHH